MVLQGRGGLTVGRYEDAQAQAEAEQADRELGTVVKLLYRRGYHEAVSTLIAVDAIRPTLDSSDWGVGYFELTLVLDVDRFAEFDNSRVLEEIKTTYNEVWRGTQREVASVSLQPSLVAPGWRQDLQAFLRPGVSNQAALAPLGSNGHIADNLKFRDVAEKHLYIAFRSKQQSLPKTDTISIVPNPGVRVPGRTWEPDFLIVYKGRVGLVEVDGSSHVKKYVSDKSRDNLLYDAGFAWVDRIDVQDAENETEAQVFVDRFIARLMRQAV